MTRRAHRLFGLASTVAVVAAVAWGFWVVGSPEARRLEKLDERRLEELQDIAREMRELVYDTKDQRLVRPLFESLSSLAEAARYRRIALEDPETGAPYQYRVIDEFRYELCATFDAARDASHAVFWNHPAGRHCFVVDVRVRP